MANVIDFAKSLVNPKTFSLIQSFKEFAESVPEIQQVHPKLDEKVNELLVVARKELDDTAEVGEELYEYGKTLLPNGTKQEIIDLVLLSVLFGKAVKAVFSP